MNALRASPFVALQPGNHGTTMQSFVPALDALKYAGYVKNVLGRYYQIRDHGDGAITVAGDGLAAITFENTPITFVVGPADNVA